MTFPTESRPSSSKTGFFARCWRLLRTASGDDAYERYLEHWRQNHADEGNTPLSRRAFFRAELERKWNGVRRCC